MTEEQHNKFLTLLMGECWHEWEWKPKDGDIHIYECKCGLRVGSRPQNPNHLSDVLDIRHVLGFLKGVDMNENQVILLPFIPPHLPLPRRISTLAWEYIVTGKQIGRAHV